MSLHPSKAMRVYIGLGSNLDDPAAQVRSGLNAIAKLDQTRLETCSSMYRSAPVGLRAQPDFVNAVCRVKTSQPPELLLQNLLEIERVHGRIRQGERGGPRTLDLDLLIYGTQTINLPEITVPHPRLHERAFVLYPLLEIDPDLVIPGKGRASDWLARCADQSITKMTDERPKTT